MESFKTRSKRRRVASGASVSFHDNLIPTPTTLPSAKFSADQIHHCRTEKKIFVYRKPLDFIFVWVFFRCIYTLRFFQVHSIKHFYHEIFLDWTKALSVTKEQVFVSMKRKQKYLIQ